MMVSSFALQMFGLHALGPYQTIKVATNLVQCIRVCPACDQRHTVILQGLKPWIRSDTDVRILLRKRGQCFGQIAFA